MQLRANQLKKHIGAGPATIYLVWGDEHLLVDEAAEEALGEIVNLGFDERQRVDMTTGGDWGEALNSARTMSLFASRRVMDIRLPGKGLDRKGSDALRAYLADPVEDTVLVFRSVGLDWRQKSAAWFKAIDQAGATVQIWPVSARDLPRWLERRSKSYGLTLSGDAIEYLSERVEGNLLAAVQVLEKLRLADHEGTVEPEHIADHTGDASHYDTFEMIDTALAGREERALKMVRLLRQEGVAIFMILGALANQVRRVRAVALGGNARLSKQRAQIVGGAASRLGADGVDRLLTDIAVLDLQCKGMMNGDAWQSLERILVAIARGTPADLEADRRLLG